MDALPWPDASSEYWWMKAKVSKRTTVTLLGKIINRLSSEYFQPFDDKNAFSRSICEGWGAQFLPGETPPEFPV